MTPLKIDNRTARWLWLDAQGLAAAPTGPCDPLATIRKLGFVQLDSIQVVSRAHHHILWSRNRNYREPMLDRLMAGRAVFEHFTHDASVLPMDMLPVWRRQFRRKEERIRKAGWFSTMLDADGRAAIRARIREEGPLSTHAFDTKVAGPRQMWSRPPHKLALDYMWYAGELATCRRDGFTKVYDLAERVFPAHLRAQEVDDREQVNRLCREALDRLAFAAPGEVQRFWDAADRKEVAGWVEREAGRLVPVEVETAEGGTTKALAPADIESRIATLRAPTSALRVLNPFDPVVRDRTRLKRLFGFDYRVEMFVPAARRVWGYYVFPVLEGERFVGRVEAKADRRAGTLDLLNLWSEPGIAWSARRRARLDAELVRLARLAGVSYDPSSSSAAM